MGKRICLLVLLIWTTMALVVCSAEPQKKNWDIPYVGRLSAPQELEIIDGKDVFEQFSKLIETAEKSSLGKTQISPPPFSYSSWADGLNDSQISFYQLALKNNGSYNTAFVFAARATDEWNKQGITFFNKLKGMDAKQQAEIHTFAETMLNGIYAKQPDFKNMFQLEVLEFYPFEQFTNKNAQIISVGGSVALRTFKIVYPVAFKVYFIQKNSHFYVFGVINSGPDRKMWEGMTKEMLSTALWSWVY